MRDYTPWILGGVGLFLLTGAGGRVIDAVSNRVKGIGSKLAPTPAAPVAGSQNQNPSAPVATNTAPTGADSAAYRAFRARLPTSSLNAQIWVQNTSGAWRYVNSAAEYGTYGIKADESNVTDVPWPNRAFNSTTYLSDPSQLFWIRSDTPSGLDGQYPQVPSSSTAALRAAFAAGQIVPVSVTGWAVLKQQGVV
jgi:hypothetical protein